METFGATISLCRKGDKNDAAVACSVTATLFSLSRQAENEISWQKFQKKFAKFWFFIKQNFAKFCLFCETKFHEISRNKHKNFAKYERNSFAKFRFTKFHRPP
jgi:hypothetical protein